MLANTPTTDVFSRFIHDILREPGSVDLRFILADWLHDHDRVFTASALRRNGYWKIHSGPTTTDSIRLYWRFRHDDAYVAMLSRLFLSACACGRYPVAIHAYGCWRCWACAAKEATRTMTGIWDTIPPDE